MGSDGHMVAPLPFAAPWVPRIAIQGLCKSLIKGSGQNDVHVMLSMITKLPATLICSLCGPDQLMKTVFGITISLLRSL